MDMTAILKHAAQLKTVSNSLSQLADGFRNPDTGKKWFLGSAVSYVSSQLLFCVEKFGAIQVDSSQEMLEAESDLKHSDTDNISPTFTRQFNRVKENIMLVVQVLYKKMLNVQRHQDKSMSLFSLYRSYSNDERLKVVSQKAIVFLHLFICT